MRTHQWLIGWLIAGVIVWAETPAIAAEESPPPVPGADAVTDTAGGGYQFEAGNQSSTNSQWDVAAAPTATGDTGKRSFYLNEDGAIRMTTHAATVDPSAAAMSGPITETTDPTPVSTEIQPAPVEVVVQELVASGVSEGEARQIAEQATHDVVEGRDAREGEQDAPKDLTPEEQALRTEVNQFAHDLQNQGLTDQQIHEQVEAQYGEQFREIAEQHQGERGDHSREQMEQMMQEHPEMMEMEREWQERAATMEIEKPVYEAPTYEKPTSEAPPTDDKEYPVQEHAGMEWH